MGLTIAVRLKAEDRELIDQVCEARGEDISSFVRRAVRRELASLSFYPDDVKKALGLECGEAVAPDPRTEEKVEA
jgi:hypothetical protein